MALFHRMLVQAGGRYLSNPFCTGSVYLVSYEMDNYAAFQQDWMRSVTEVKEVPLANPLTRARRWLTGRVRNLSMS